MSEVLINELRDKIVKLYDDGFNLGWKFRDKFRNNEFVLKKWDDLTDDHVVMLLLGLHMSDRDICKMFHIGYSKIANRREKLRINPWNSPERLYDWIRYRIFDKVIDLDQFIKEISV